MTCTRAVWLLPSPAGLSQWFASGISEVSRFSCMEFPDVHGVYDYAGPPNSSRCRCWTCGLPRWVQRRRPACKFSKLDTQPIFSPVYASLDTSQRPAQNSGPSGSLLLSREALASSTPCRFIPAHHHIFFPPRLEVVAEKENADGFPAHTRHQSPSDGFFGYQSHRPPGETLGWIAANHGDDALFLAVLQQSFGSRTLLLVKRPLQTAFAVAMADLPDRLRRQRHHTRNLGSAHALSELEKRHCPQHNSHLLHTAAEQSPQFLFVFGCDFNA